MAKKILSGFSTVSDNIYDNPKQDNTEIDPLLVDIDEEKIVKKQVSIYLDTDVIEALNTFGRVKGKGAKSTLVNNFLKQYLNVRQDDNI